MPVEIHTYRNDAKSGFIEEGSSATDSVTDVTDVTDVTHVRKRSEGRSSNSNGFSDRECPNRLGGCYT